MSVSNYAEDAVLNALFNGASLAKTTRFAQLHVGDPGEDGLNNAAVETTRKSITSAAASGGTFTSTNALTWTAVAATETYTHLSIWDASTAGNCLWTGAMNGAYSVNAGDTFTIAAGALAASLD